ncbi:hypothetical protein BKA67DRAFT_661927 [Truncatella angustata]|uniref:Ubiquitin-like domain-containing protein n=1 Tax=Truncatella angustata TaxID=152316 RepID=A0A9P8ZUA1_9PEZI|nr:uncharacterized protein BKA67DRAFT_661927 [Truncatella angustata]KAH6648996.1 hypothetical protein BKA67DRAFT_661927 [Truncatella angustata]KAH8200766.1 hypothetical protein TruAng_005083 [Truncatella angustata]
MASSDSDAGSSSGDEAQAFTLQILSPSIGVPQPLNFNNVPETITVRQLKEQLQNRIDTKPAAQAQRLIHRGRLLATDEDTMLKIFGEDEIRSGAPQTLHLVLRETSDIRPASIPLPPHSSHNQSAPSTHNQQSAPAAPPPPPQQPQQQQPLPRNPNPHAPFPHLPQLSHVHAGAPLQNLPFGFQQPGFPQPPAVGIPSQAHPAHLPFGFGTPQQIAQHQRQWMTNMADPQRLQEIINQTQRERAALGLNGAQDAHVASTGAATGQPTDRNASPYQPDGTRTVVREGVGPGGQSWRITVNETVTTTQTPQRNPRTGSPFPPADISNMFRPPAGAPQPPRSVPLAGPHGALHGGQLSGVDVHNILRTADAGQAATRVMADAMRRNTSNSSLVSLGNSQANQPIAPGVTVPSRTGSAMGTPDPIRAAQNHSQPTSQQQAQASAPTVPEVYILSSPEGPRALLVNGSSSAYFTPLSQQALEAQASAERMRRRQLLYQQNMGAFGFLPGLAPPHDQHQQQQQRVPTRTIGSWSPPTGDQAVQQLQQHQHQHQQPQAQPQAPAPLVQGLPALPHAQPQMGHAVARPGNVQVRAIAVAQIWPHIWMVIRLVLFVWWFTSPTASWQRWFTVMAIALTLFLVNTGLLTPIAEQFWTPLRRHLDNIMPAADNHGRDRPAPAENAGAGYDHAGAPGERRAPDPVETAARLVRERRVANGNWLMTQARRLERAGILFLASIAPGVAERHIAQLEAEARAERQRREEAEAAAAEAARVAAENAQSGEGAGADAAGQAEPARDDPEAPRPHNPENPLIAI